MNQAWPTKSLVRVRMSASSTSLRKFAKREFR
jgi:hypothetical protein